MCRALAAALICAAPAAASPQGDLQPGSRVVEKVVAVIRTPASTQPRVVTLTRLVEQTRIALVSQGAADAAEKELDGPALRAGLEWLIGQILLYDEVVRLRVFEVDRAEVLDELRRFQGRFAQPGAFRAFLAHSDLTEEELLVVLRRTLRVQHYLESRLSGAARTTEADVDRYLAERRVEAGAAGRTAVRAAVKAKLTEERMGREAKALLTELRSRAEVRVLERFDGEPG